ncbi:hypothetical protein V496_03390 [Pseudogymnoascus sp. VKM F-4515 (FW-2607)]|nr:hypothetical protein V496_03390 [Pseudogymnoascus sp. VKM F-4515 (FW-2607)]KFY87993.1 hypothetical protein V498_06939 [Pseudogymnoascus sp. VKM F-4517 (FW-2822)]
MADPERYWPGGIPSHVRCHDNPIDDFDTFKEEVKGWQLYLEENVTSHDGGSQEQILTVTRRRQLVEEWATMSQNSRDSYQERAPLRDSDGWFPAELAANEKNYQPDGECSLIIPEPISPRNWALWTKIRILLYNHDGEEHGTLWGSGDSTTCICRPNPAGPNPVTVDGYNAWYFIEPAIFEYMTMTSTGTVVFHRWKGSIFVADQETLDTGRLLLCAFQNKGSLEKSGRIWPVFTKDIHNFIVGLGKPAYSLIEGDLWTFDEEAPSGNMERPILEVMSTLATECAYFDEDGRGVDLWREDIESYAPGYLEMEEAGDGMAVDYDHDNFRED